MVDQSDHVAVSTLGDGGGRGCIPDIYRACRSLRAKWSPRRHRKASRHPSPPPPPPPTTRRSASRSRSQKRIDPVRLSAPRDPHPLPVSPPRTLNEDFVDVDRQEEERPKMNGLNGFRYSMKDPRSPRGFIGQRVTIDPHLSPVPSFSSARSVSRKMNSFSFKEMQGRRSLDAMTYQASLSRNSSRRTTTPIMFSNSQGMMKPGPIEQDLECTLEELCFGCTKKIKVTRDVLTNAGQIIQEEELLTIKVKPGWKAGTKITFQGMGNERPGVYPADVNFIIAEKEHSLFRREGDDLELAIEVPLVKALTGCEISVPLLGGEKLDMTIDEVLHPGYQKVVVGQGMPISKEKGQRGNLKVVFLVEFPKELTDEQRKEVKCILQQDSSSP
ncbi:hypothetical protein MLD38_022461 [Melastoma candidum]|uniref:Uncharacterized protein n=1 Tax=Melastoma candidum TaxID=119954 RepID=A0ACB9QJD0_9MYRT|nr:hypothetical protein MLD38_022461 [Melastoma candidum]